MMVNADHAKSDVGPSEGAFDACVGECPEFPMFRIAPVAGCAHDHSSVRIRNIRTFTEWGSHSLDCRTEMTLDDGCVVTRTISLCVMPPQPRPAPPVASDELSAAVNRGEREVAPPEKVTPSPPRDRPPSTRTDADGDSATLATAALLVRTNDDPEQEDEPLDSQREDLGETITPANESDCSMEAEGDDAKTADAHQLIAGTDEETERETQSEGVLSDDWEGIVLLDEDIERL